MTPPTHHRAVAAPTPKDTVQAGEDEATASATETALDQAPVGAAAGREALVTEADKSTDSSTSTGPDVDAKVTHTQTWDVFISHASEDRETAMWLVDNLREHGYMVWCDSGHIQPGDSIIERVNDGLTKSANVIICTSRVTRNSGYQQKEWMSTLARQLHHDDVGLVLVKTKAGAQPAILDSGYIDITTDGEHGFAELYGALKQTRQDSRRLVAFVSTAAFCQIEDTGDPDSSC